MGRTILFVSTMAMLSSIFSGPPATAQDQKQVSQPLGTDEKAIREKVASLYRRYAECAHDPFARFDLEPRLIREFRPLGDHGIQCLIDMFRKDKDEGWQQQEKRARYVRMMLPYVGKMACELLIINYKSAEDPIFKREILGALCDQEYREVFAVFVDAFSDTRVLDNSAKGGELRRSRICDYAYYGLLVHTLGYNNPINDNTSLSSLSEAESDRRIAKLKAWWEKNREEYEKKYPSYTEEEDKDAGLTVEEKTIKRKVEEFYKKYADDPDGRPALEQRLKQEFQPLGDKGIQFLIDMLRKDKDELWEEHDVKTSHVRAMLPHIGPKACEVLIKNCETTDPFLKGEVIWALGGFKYHEIFPYFHDALSDERLCEEQIRWIGRRPLQICDIAYEQLIPHATGIEDSVGKGRSIRSVRYGDAFLMIMTLKDWWKDNITHKGKQTLDQYPSYKDENRDKKEEKEKNTR